MVEPQQANVEVFARLRPGAAPDELSEVHVTSRYGQQKHVQVRNLEFSLDWVFDSSATQEDVYEVVGANLPMLLQGYKVTIIAYGQTGSGKTYTMFGPQEVLEYFETSDRSLHGCGPRACLQLFETIRESPAGSSWLVQCTYLEVYNGVVNDLLTGRKNLMLRETAERGLFVDGLSSEVITDASQAMDALTRGNANRVVAAMKMNDRSSRGHAIFSLQLQEVVEDDGKGSENTSRLDLVDLAGMESSKKSYAVEGPSNNPARREESKNINTSLYALGSVVERLSARKEASHIPFRDTKLTRLLQDSLSGNCSAAMVVALRTESTNTEETIGTLRFAQRAKAIPVRLRQSVLPRGELGAIKAQLEEALSQLSDSKNHAERLQLQLDQQSLWTTEYDATLSPALGEGAAAAKLNRQNRALRLSLVMQRLAAIRQAEHMESLSSEHAKAMQRLRELETAYSAISRDSPQQLPRGQGAPSPLKGNGAMGASWGRVSFSRVSSMRMKNTTPLSEEQQRYEKFQQLATARKLALASRGYEVMNVFIDSLYDLAIKERHPERNWHAFLRKQIPSPEPQQPGDSPPSNDGQLPSLRHRGPMATVRQFSMPFDDQPPPETARPIAVPATPTRMAGFDSVRVARVKGPEGEAPQRARVSPPLGSRRGLALQLEAEEEGWRSKVDLDVHTHDVYGLPLDSLGVSQRASADPSSLADDHAGKPQLALAGRATTDAVLAARKAAAASAGAREAAARALAAAATAYE